MKRRTFGILAGMIVSAAAIACATLPLPIPPLPIKLSWTDLAKAKSEGFSNPGHAAAMKKIDSYASTVVGDDAWKKNNYQGYFTYSSPLGGANIIWIDKPCGKKAAELSDKDSKEGDGGAVGGGEIDFGMGNNGNGKPFENCFTNTVKACTSAGGGKEVCEYQTFLECPDFGLG